jgi:hypothetical protein
MVVVCDYLLLCRVRYDTLKWVKKYGFAIRASFNKNNAIMKQYKDTAKRDLAKNHDIS